MTTDAGIAGAAKPRDYFATTHWTVVLAACRSDTPRAGDAMSRLCESYWYPLYAYIRRQGHSSHDAQDLTQEFFARLLEKHWLKQADRDKGRFRTFLLVALKRFLANEWDRARAQKRGGDRIVLSLDTSAAETRYQMEAATEIPAEKVYDRRWAMTLLDRTLSRLREEFLRDGKGAEFDRLKGFLTAEKNANYAVTAASLGLSEGAVRVAVHRVRRRFRELFREEISHTVATPEEIDQEVRYLLSALAD